MFLRLENLNMRQARAAVLITVSGLLFLFGGASAWSMAWPLMVNSRTEPVVYYPPLPVVEDKTEVPMVTEVPLKQLFPELIPIETTDPGNWLRIPSIGVAVPLVMSQTIADKDVLETLAAGAALYPNGIVPGRPGNTFVAAHSTGEPWKGKYRFAFLKINELTSNNLIHVDYNNTRYTYRIVETKIINPDKTVLIESETQVPRITLMACWPLWSTKQRMLITGELANVTKLTSKPS